MPLRRHAASRSSDSYSQPSSSRPRRSNGHDSPRASSSQSTTPHRKSRNSQEPKSPNGSKHATLGDLLSSTPDSRSARTARRVIELLDSSDSEPPSPTKATSKPADDDLDLDDVVTPELPPADASAPAIPDDIEVLPGTPPEASTVEVVVDDPPSEAEEETQPDLSRTESRIASPEPPPDPTANQRPIFDPQELEMQPLYDELKALLETEHASDSDDDDEDYEERRQRKLRANEALLAQLGLAASGIKPRPVEPPVDDAASEDDHDEADDQPTVMLETPRRGRGRPKKRVRDSSTHPSDPGLEPRTNKRKKYDRKVRFAEDGTTKSAPLPGETFDLAYVDVPSLRDRARNDYVFVRDVPEIRPEDLIPWSEDEEDPEEEEDEVMVLEDFDDDGFQGYDSLGRMKRRRRKRQPDFLPDGTELTSCHQCRRKTPGSKMRCRRMRDGSECGLMYCRRCIEVRYGMDFNSDDQTFHCPRCLGYCNCSVCLRRSGFGDLVHKGRERLLAFTDKLRTLSKTKGLESLEGRLDAILASTAALEMDAPTPKSRKPNGRPVKREPKVPKDPNAPVFGPQKRRGRPPKNRPVIENLPKLELSEEVAEDEVFSPMEEYALGRLAVARRVLKHVAIKRAAMPRKKIVVKFKRSQRTFPLAPSAVTVGAVAAEKKKIPNYHDMEKDVWVRSAADYSTSESEVDELVDELADEGSDVGEDNAEEVFEEGRTQVFAGSLLQRANHNFSSSNSGDSSPLTSLEDLDSYSEASSQYGEDKDQFLSAEAEDEAGASILSATTLPMPQTMQQIALAVLEEHDGRIKAGQADFARSLLEEPSAFPTSSGSEAGQFSALLDPEPQAGTPLFFADASHNDV